MSKQKRKVAGHRQAGRKQNRSRKAMQKRRVQKAAGGEDAEK